MPKLESLVGLLNGIKFIEKTYDVMRIVDPVRKKVLNLDKDTITETNFVCHSFWDKKNMCDNCVSIRAYQENEVFIKLEYHNDKVYMVLAIPTTIDEKTVIIELLKDVSNNLLVTKEEKGIEVDIHSLISNSNDLLLKDHLTGLYNRRFIDERLQVDIIDNSLHKGSLSLIMADIDLFKTVNDTYGHIAGDFILKEIAVILSSCIRGGKDWLARYGGEEFLICLPNTKKDVAALIAERMRTKIEDRIFEYEGIKIKLTISFGVHSLVNEDESNIEDIINLADQNLYKAKNSGRNMVVSS